MPVYNAGPYIEKSIKSILGQSFQDFELIIIDDCSKDRSYESCQSMAALDDRIILLRNDRNQGAAETRNRALKLARGMYVSFVDADDSIDRDLLEIVHARLKADPCDCLKTGCREEYFRNDGTLKYAKKCSLENEKFTEDSDICLQILKMEEIPLFGYVWNGFYRNELIRKHDIQFAPDLKVNEDFDFNIHYFKWVRSFQCLDYEGYLYAKRLTDSLSSSKINYTYDQYMMKIRLFLQFLREKEQEDLIGESELFWIYTRFCYAWLTKPAQSDGKFSSRLRTLRQDVLFSEYRKSGFTGHSKKQKLLVQLLKGGNTRMLQVLCSSIRFVQAYFPVLFAVMKR